MIGAYHEPDRSRGTQLMTTLIESVTAGVPTAPTELRARRRTLNKQAEDAPAHIDRPGTSNGPTEATNGRPEHLHGSTLGLQNLTNHNATSPHETGGSTPHPHPQLG